TPLAARSAWSISLISISSSSSRWPWCSPLKMTESALGILSTVSVFAIRSQSIGPGCSAPMLRIKSSRTARTTLVSAPRSAGSSDRSRMTVWLRTGNLGSGKMIPLSSRQSNHVLSRSDDRVDLDIDVVVDHRLIVRHVERAALDARRGDKFACAGVILQRWIVVRLEADFERHGLSDAVDGDLARNVCGRC